MMNTKKKLILSFLVSFFSASFCMENKKVQIRYFVTFKKGDNQLGRVQDLKTLFALEKMAKASYRNLYNEKFAASSFSDLEEAKKQFNARQEITIEKNVIKDFLTYILCDGGRIEFWKFPDGKIVDLNVQLTDQRGKSIFIEGPILTIAREAKFVTQQPDVIQITHNEQDTSDKGTRCLIQ